MGIEERLDLLEQKLFRLRLMTWGLAIGIVVIVAMAAAKSARTPSPEHPDVMTLSKLVITDSAGTPRVILSGEWESNGYKGSGILWQNESGSTRMMSGIINGLAMTGYSDDKGTGRVVVSAGDEGGSVVFSDADKNKRMAIVSDNSDYSGIACKDREGRYRIIIGTDARQAAYLKIDDTKGRTRLGLVTTSDENAFFQMNDTDQRLRLSAGAAKAEDAGWIKLYNADGKAIKVLP